MSSFKAATSIHHHLPASLLPLCDPICLLEDGDPGVGLTDWTFILRGCDLAPDWTSRLVFGTSLFSGEHLLNVQPVVGATALRSARADSCFLLPSSPLLSHSGAGSLHSIKQTLWPPPHFYLTFYLAVTNERQLDYNIICLLFITGTKDTIH